MSMSEAFSFLFYTLIKLCYTKALEWSSLVQSLIFGPKAKSSSSEIMNLTSFTISYHLGGSSRIFRTRSEAALEWLWGDTHIQGREAPARQLALWRRAAASWCWSNFEEIPHIQGQRRSPNKMVGGAKSSLESSPIPARDAQRARKYLVHTRTQRPHSDWDRPVFECLLLRRYGSAVDCHRGRGSGCSRPGYGVNPLGGGHH